MKTAIEMLRKQLGYAEGNLEDLAREVARCTKVQLDTCALYEQQRKTVDDYKAALAKLEGA